MWRLIREAGAPLSEQVVIDVCRGRMASFKTTRRVDFVEQFPLTGSGKLQTYLLRADAERLSIAPHSVHLRDNEGLLRR